MRAVAEEVLPENFSTSLAGQARDFEESASSLLYAFILALILVYLVLAAQFESWVDPFIIMLTVPLSLLGAVASLHAFGQTLNVFSQIGIIMLVGLVTKNGILIVEFANQRKAQGMTVLEAVTDAAAARFRPILMTSLSTILGILPIAMTTGGAGGSRRSMGIAVVGGLIIATILTLYVVPAVYSFLSSEYSRRTDEDEADEAIPQPLPEREAASAIR
jgi:multidrug efflux pump